MSDANEPEYHAVAKCRWCGGRFVRVFFSQWACENEECFERCKSHAILRREEPKAEESPYLFFPLPFQVDCLEHPVSKLLVAGAAGVSKSFFGRWWLYSWCKKVPGFRGLLLRCTYDQLNKNHLTFMPKEAKLLGAKFAAKEFTVFHEGDEDSIIFAGYCDDAADIAQHVGPEWDGIVLEEGVTLLPQAINEISARARGSSTARAAKKRLGLPQEGQCRILTNPGGRAMLYLIDHYIERNPDRDEYPNYEPDEHSVMTGTLDDNPYLGPDYERKNLSHLTAARYKQLRYGDWSVMAGQFFGSYDPSRHIASL